MIDGKPRPDGQQRLQYTSATAQRVVDQRFVVGVQHVEEVRTGRSETAHGLLEDQRLTLLVDPECFAIEHHRSRRHPPDQIDNPGKRGGDVVESATEQPHFVAALVCLHADAVELPLHAGQPDLGQGVGDTGRRAGEHRLHRGQRSEADVERLRRQCQPCRPSQVTEQHRSAPDRSDRLTTGLPDSVRDHAFVGTLAQFAGEDPVEVVLLGLGCGRPQIAHHPHTFALRTAALEASHDRECGVDVVDGERWLGCRGDPQVRHRRPTNTEPALTGLTDQQADRRFDFVSRGRPQQLGERGDLLRSLGGGRDALRCGSQVSVEHRRLSLSRS